MVQHNKSHAATGRFELGSIPVRFPQLLARASGFDFNLNCRRHGTPNDAFASF